MSLKKKKENSYAINEYDNDPREIHRRKFERRKRKKALLITFVIFALFLTGLYYNSDYCTLQTITITGNKYVSTATIRNAINLETTDIRVLVSKNTLNSEITALPGVASVKIKKNIIEGLVLEIEEDEIIAFSKDSGTYKLIYADGSIGDLLDDTMISKIQTFPCCSNFGEDLEAFATKYAKISKTIRSQFSDISYSDEDGDPGKITITTSDGRTINVRLRDMVDQLNSYNNLISENPDKTYFDFIGNNIYMK